MRRVFLIRNIASNEFGGSEIYQIELAKILIKNNFDVFILTASKKLLKEAKILGIKTIEIPYNKQQNWSGWRNFLFPIYVIKQFKLCFWYKKILKEYNPEVVNIQSRDEWIAVTRAAKQLGIKVLWTDHADFKNWVLINVKVAYKNWIGKWILKCAEKADKIIMISDSEYKWFKKEVPSYKAKNIVVIKNGVKDCLSEYKDIKPEARSFVYLGRLTEEKGINELVKAFKKVYEKYPDAKLNLYGEGKLKTDCKGIIFHGFTNEPMKVLAENDSFVLSSYREGLSLSLLNAIMMKKKIIVSNIEGNLEVINDYKNGLVVPVKNSKELARAMIYSIENPKDMERMAENARKRYEEEFDFDKIFAEKMLILYNKRKENI